MQENSRLFRDGSTQVSRMPGPLDPGYVSVEERSTKRLIEYAKKFAEYLRYVDLTDVVNGYWTELFNFEAKDFEELVAFAENPDLFADEPAKRSKFDQPHRMLFLTFLNLLKHPKSQLDELTGRHLDHYYRVVLQLMEKAAIPDRLHAVFKPVKGQGPHLIEMGRALDAGKDSAGNALVYHTDEQIVVNQAKLGDVKTTYLEETVLDFQTIYNRYLDKADYSLTPEQKLKEEIGFYKAAGFNDIFRWAFSDPQGEYLPEYPEIVPDQDYDVIKPPGIPGTELLSRKIPVYYLGSNKNLAPVQTYILEKLYFESIEDFRFCFDIFKWDYNQGPTVPTAEHWDQVWNKIDAAFQRRLKTDYGLLVLFLKENFAYQADDPAFPGNETEEVFDALAKFAFGYPDSNCNLPKAPGFEALEVPLREFVSSVNYNPETCVDEISFMYPWVETYVTTNLYMTADEFKRFMIAKVQPELGPDGLVWRDEFYEIVADAIIERKYHPFFRPVNNVIATTIAEGAPGKPAELTQFHPFAEVPDENSALSSVGFAITSPLLNLAEGKRSVNARFVCKPNSFDYRAIKTLTLENPITKPAFLPFDLYASSEDKWIKVEDISVRMGWIMTSSRSVEGPFEGRLLNGIFVPMCADPPDFSDGSYLLTPSMDLYEILGPSSDGIGFNVSLIQELVFQSADITTIEKNNFYKLTPYTGTGTFVKTHVAAEEDRQFFEVAFTMDKDLPPITPFVEDAGVTDIDSIHSILKFELKKLTVEPFNARHPSLCNQAKQVIPDDAESYTLYHTFRNLQLEKIDITVDVKDQEDLLLANDAGVIKPGAPFAPFGLRPTVGSSLFFGSRELCEKKLNSLTLSVEWKDLPADLNTYYQTYTVVSEVLNNPSKIDTNAFKARLKCLVKGTWVNVGPSDPYQNHKRLFIPDDASDDDTQQTTSDLEIAFDHMDQTPDYYVRVFPTEAEYEAPGQLPRYFRLELGPNDFLHKYYALAQRNAILGCSSPPCTGTDLKDINEPYLPMLKRFAVSYTASTVIDFTVDENEDVCDINDKLIQIHPFGHLYTWPVELRYDLNTTASLSGVDNNTYYLMPQFDADGYLYLGFWDLLPSQSLSLLFKPIVFTGDSANYRAPKIVWYSLYQNFWDRFHPNNVSDTSHGLLTEGITKFILPSTLDEKNRIVPPGRRWLRGSVDNETINEIGVKSINAKAIPELLSIWPQAVRATFVDQNNAPDHLTLPLAAETVTGFVDTDPIIESVTQPYNSFDGRPGETGNFYYRRVAERLRHKDRSITLWDYEHLVLEAFPNIYNAKCLVQQEMARLPAWDHTYISADADVTLVVIPDIANTAPLFPLTPTLPQYQLDEVRVYLSDHTSPFVNMSVKNPRYEHIKYSFKVKFKAGMDPNYYVVQINEDLKAFLSPWAYKEHAPISFGSRIYNAKVVHFLDALSYVDYILDFVLWLEREDSLENPGDILYAPVEDVAVTRYPDSILVSAEQHDIEVIEEGAYSKPEGIGYMEIEKDFYVYTYSG